MLKIGLKFIGLEFYHGGSYKVEKINGDDCLVKSKDYDGNFFNITLSLQGTIRCLLDGTFKITFIPVGKCKKCCLG